ncbi:MAG: preprotein translocase subunit SecG [Muribaculaceae bacterium]|nr:preprotein translocase subunit SecG [Muribaculaceae bacterium]
MQQVLIVITVIISIVLIGAVLIQKSKGGGLSSSFAGANQIMGVRGTNSFIEKATWTLAIIICFTSLLSGILLTRSNNTGDQPLVKDVNAVEQFPGSYDTATATDEATPVLGTDEAVETIEAVEVAEPAAEQE